MAENAAADISSLLKLGPPRGALVQLAQHDSAKGALARKREYQFSLAVVDHS